MEDLNATIQVEKVKAPAGTSSMPAAAFRHQLSRIMDLTEPHRIRILVERNGRPVGAWIPAEDLEHLPATA